MLGLAIALSGCELFVGRAQAPVSPAPVVAVPDDDDHLEWAKNEEYFVVVRKTCRTLDVYRYGERVQSYPAVFGLGGNSASKLYEGDLRTPSGLYAIVGKRRHPRWHRFLLLDYPNTQDVNRYWQALEANDIPRDGRRYAGIGGSVGIHGTDKPGLNQKGVDWTWGCISIDNDAIEQLAGTVPVGTLVLIED
jgi:murein L,D-transpeptidase YafK